MSAYAEQTNGRSKLDEFRPQPAPGGSDQPHSRLERDRRPEQTPHLTAWGNDRSAESDHKINGTRRVASAYRGNETLASSISMDNLGAGTMGNAIPAAPNNRNHENRERRSLAFWFFVMALVSVALRSAYLLALPADRPDFFANAQSVWSSCHISKGMIDCR